MVSRDADECAGRQCHRALRGHAFTADRTGRKFCKRCGDKLPPYLRRPRSVRNKVESETT
jgi:hypothetical protein